MKVLELASYRLREVAYYWFELWEESREEGSPPAMWNKFTDAFIDHFLPNETKADRATKFESVRQGSLSMWEYHMRFVHLSKYVVYMLPTMEARVRRFVQGFSPLVINETATTSLNSDMNYGMMVAFSQATENHKLKNRMEQNSAILEVLWVVMMVGHHSREGHQGHPSLLLSLQLVQRRQVPVNSSGVILGSVKAIGDPTSRVGLVGYSISSGGPHVLGVVFPDDLPGIPPDKEIDFRIKVMPSTEGIKVDPQKIAAMKNWPRLTTPTEIRSFVGLAGYYRKFVDELSTLTYPLTKLTQKAIKFQWLDAYERSLQELKSRLTMAPVLTLPEGTGGFVKELNLRQRRWLELLKDYDIDILYHPGKANVMAAALSQKSMGSLAHLEAYQRPLAKEVHRLASLGVRLADSSEGGVIVQTRAKLSLVVEVKEKQYNDTLWYMEPTKKARTGQGDNATPRMAVNSLLDNAGEHPRGENILLTTTLPDSTIPDQTEPVPASTEGATIPPTNTPVPPPVPACSPDVSDGDLRGSIQMLAQIVASQA
ncbi:uncharacterized protein [Nicotiana tomentosiformis]|uniref:uncharacterized protein n=1 Tax=Nicotiana tomentosiformis TaxID=4098 RepID=UPI00388CE1DC